jgi:hypothetical protein
MAVPLAAEALPARLDKRGRSPFADPAEPTADGERRLLTWSFLAGGLLLLALAAPWLAGRVYTADDLGAFHLPLRAFFARQLAAGGSYDWMPGLFSGFYLTGEGQAGVYHPWHQFLYRFLPLPTAMGLECLISYPVMMLGTWFLLGRRLGRGSAAAFGALLFAFSGFNLLHFVHPNAVAVIAHVPWLLWATDIVLSDSRRRRVAAATAMIALLTGSQLLLGYPQYVWFSLLAEVSYAVWLLIENRYAPRSGCGFCATCDECVGCTSRTWPRLVIAKGIGLLIGGVQLAPTLDAWWHSTRPAAAASFSAWGSLHPLNLLQLVAPYLFVGRVVGDNTHEFAVYAGAVPLLLVVWLIARRRELGSLASLAWAAGGLAAVALVLALGGYGPLYCAVVWLPLIDTFRFPCRYLVLFQLAVAVLAAIGFLLLVQESCRARQRRSVGQAANVPRTRPDGRPARAQQRFWRDFEPLWGVVGLSAAVALVGLGYHREAHIASIPEILAGPALLAVAAGLVIAAARGSFGALVLLVVFTACDLGWYGLGGAVYPRSALLDQYIASVAVPPGKPEGRVLGSLLRCDEPGTRVGDEMVLAGRQRADGYAGLEPHRQLDYELLSALRVAGVRWVESNDSTDDIAGLENYGDPWMEVPHPLPRVRLVTRVQTSAEPSIDIARIAPERTALCDVPLALPPSAPGTAAVTAESPGRMAIDVQCPAKQLLVVAESYHPGWQAAVDGCQRELYRVNGDFMGCLVDGGKHAVMLNFRPDSLQSGWLATWLGLGLLSLCFLGANVPGKSTFFKGNHL